MMNNHNLPLHQSCAIIGMDMFTPHCPDLWAFRRMLLTGRQDAAVLTSEAVGQMRDVPGSTSSESAEPFRSLVDEGRFLQVIERAWMDAGIDYSPTHTEHLPIVMDVPSGFYDGLDLTGSQWLDAVFKGTNAQDNLPVSADSPIMIREGFDDAMHACLSLLQRTECAPVIFCSLFSYLQIGFSDELPKPSSDRIGEKPDSLTGIGCLVFSNSRQVGHAYADIQWEVSRIAQSDEQDRPAAGYDHPQNADRWSNTHAVKHWHDRNQVEVNLSIDVLAEEDNPSASSAKNTQLNAFPHFQYSPVVQVIKSALSLNSQTHFSNIPAGSFNDGQSVQDTPVGMRPWFMQPYTEKRESEIRLQREKDRLFMVWLEKDHSQGSHSEHPFSAFGYYLLPVSFDGQQDFFPRIDGLLDAIDNCADISDFCGRSLVQEMRAEPASHALVVLGSTRQELMNELAHARTGVMRSFKTGKDWQTPSGSYFTPQPMGPHEKIAFIYPGAFSTYVGMGREIFYLFPQLHESMQALTSDPGSTINEEIIFPQELSKEKITQLQQELDSQPIQMISSGICFSYLYTLIIRDILMVKPHAAFGYSLGENSMMYALGIWAQADAMRTSLEISPIFHERVSGPQHAIREFWRLALSNDRTANQSIWANYVLMAPVETVQAAIRNEERVYITHINTPRQVVIGGEREACRRVADALKCMHLEAPYRHAIHCPPVASEFSDFQRLHDWPVEAESDIPIYSAADYAALPIDSRGIADSFAKMLTHSVDFPRLVELAYQDGARVFIELGAGSNCSKWVEAILKGRPHTAMSINHQHQEDHESILRMVARLVSHRIPVALDALIR